MMNLHDAREKLGAVLTPVADTDPTVLTNLVDTIEPPALMIGWGENWLEPDTACMLRGELVITAVAGRLVPGEGVTRLEDLVEYTLGRLSADLGKWPIVGVSGPRVFPVARTNYIAARITVRVVIASP